MEKFKGTYLDKNGNKVKTDNIFNDPKILNVIKNGGEICIPANRPDMYIFLREMQKVNPKIKIKQVGSVKAAFIKDEFMKDIYTKHNLKEFKKLSANEVERLEYFFENIFKDEKNMVNGLHIFINKIDKTFLDNYDLILDIIVKKYISKICLNGDMVIFHKPRKDNYFEGEPTDKEIATTLSNEMLLLFQKRKIKDINTLDYITQQLPKEYSYKRIQCIIFACFNYLLILTTQSKRGDKNC